MGKHASGGTISRENMSAKPFYKELACSSVIFWLCSPSIVYIFKANATITVNAGRQGKQNCRRAAGPYTIAVIKVFHVLLTWFSSSEIQLSKGALIL